MHALLVAAAFTISPSQSCEFTTPSAAATYLQSRVQTGTLLLSQGDCLAVKVFTRSPYTHVATVVKHKGQTYVYESANGYGVIKETLANYLKSECPTKIYVLNPAVPFSPKRSREYVKFLESQMGRPYGIQHHIRGTRAEGVHCAEYVTDALMKIDLLHANRPSRVSPGSLAQGVVQSDLYAESIAVCLKETVKRPVGKNCCHQFWLDTKLCTNRLYVKMRRWFTCR